MFQNEIFRYFYLSPVGILEIQSSEKNLFSLQFVEHFLENSPQIPEILLKTSQQLDEYFNGIRTIFDLKMELFGTNFQIKVWKELQKIPFGETISYFELARRIENPLAARAVGGANHRNPIVILIPCHRVIGKNGTLVGYGGRMDRKEWLLNFEKQKKN